MGAVLLSIRYLYIQFFQTEKADLVSPFSKIAKTKQAHVIVPIHTETELSSADVFPNYPSFNVILQILSYFDYSQGVRNHLQVLSHSTRLYYFKHEKYFKESFCHYRPEPTFLYKFGHIEHDHSWT